MDHSSLALLTGGDAAGLEVYGLEQLLAVAGEQLGEEISPRTVRLYATQGLIDRPGKEGRSAIYGRRHLLQLLLIRTLARRGLSLAAIAPLAACGDAELLEQLLHLGEQPAGEPGCDASSPASTEQQEALAYLQSLQSESESSASRRERSPSLLPLLGSPLSASSPSLSPRRSLTPRTAGRSSAASSRWHRFSLAPGVELHLSEAASIPPAGDRREAWLMRLLDRLREQLDNEG